MGVSYYCASSILLCPEDNTSVLGFDDGEEQGADGEARRYNVSQIEGQKSGLYGETLMGFPLQSEDCIALLVERESHHLPGKDYAQRFLTGAIDLVVRADAIDWIEKVHSHYHFGPLSAYLSVNYLDRFLSAYELPQDKAWMNQLLSVACLSLAAKMEETEVPLSLDLQVANAKYVFEARTIQRMELLVLSTLKWRMQSVTPFSFIGYFLCKLSNGNFPKIASISSSVELILLTVRGIEFLEFKPSEIAAAVALAALEEEQIMDIGKTLDCCNHVDKERVIRCYEVIQKKTMLKKRAYKNASSVSSVPRSPNGVLDAACVSYKSDDITVGSSANSLQTSPLAKRRKLDIPQIS